MTARRRYTVTRDNVGVKTEAEAPPAASQCVALPYYPDGSQVFATLRDLTGAVFLDSGCGHGDAGRYDLIAASPDPQRSATLCATPDAAAVDAFFARLDKVHKAAALSHRARSHDLPFSGGLIGYLGYDAGLPLHGLTINDSAGAAQALPAAQVGYYPWSIVQDHLRGESWLVADGSIARNELAEIVERVHSAAPPTAGFALETEFNANMLAADYAGAFARISQYIQAGDCYQVNLAQRFSARYTGDPLAAYRLLRPLAAAAFSGYMDIAAGQALMCLSPERFISLREGEVATQPIKGTRPRSDDPARDLAIARELQDSVKDRAENLMIVDLLRNDLGHSCQPGSIQVDSLFALRSYPSVHHLVSTIRGRLQDDRTAVDLLRDSFPGGSVTGAPKRRAMQIIAELEPHPRQAYCGSFFYLCNSGRMDSNITIRSMVADQGKLHCWAGGGIVADSRCAAEYQETFDKVGAFLQALENCRASTTRQ